MAKLTLFDLCGVQTAGEMAAIWPRGYVRFLPGLPAAGDDPSDFERLVTYLNRALTFQAVRPGASVDRLDLTGLGDGFAPVHRVGLTADVVISHLGLPPTEISTLVLNGLFDMPFTLIETAPGKPARLFVTKSERGLELVIEGLAVEMQVPTDLLGPLRSEGEEQGSPGGGPDVTLTSEPFEAGVYDSLAIVLREPLPSLLRMHVKLRVTEEWDFILEPAVPISLGPCRFMGLPCTAVHDLAFVPSPTLRGDHHPTEQALEWTRHTINPIELYGEHIAHVGLVTARTLDLDLTREPLATVMRGLNDSIVDDADKLEIVLEDIAVPLAILPPLPVHARFGLRRKVAKGSEVAEAYDLTLAPASVRIPRLSETYRLLLFRLLLETVEPPTLRGAFVEGAQTSTSSAATISAREDGLLQVGWMWGEPYGTTVLGIRIELKGLKLGLDLPEFFKALGSWDSHFQLLADLKLRFVRTEAQADGTFKITSKSGKDADVYWYDVGWDRGRPSLTHVESPGFEVSIADVFKARIDEMGFVTENNGGQYFVISGGFPFLEAGDSNNGIFFHRLRFRLGGNETAPAWLLDGLTLAAKIGRVQLGGSGMISEFVRESHRYREFAFGVTAGFRAASKDFLITLQVLKGRVSGPSHNFTYWLFAAKLTATIPLFLGLELQNARVLVAKNMTPLLGPPDPDGQEMRLFKWYKAQPDGLTLPANRVLGGWQPQDDSLTVGVGARASTAGASTLALELFALLHDSPADGGLLIGLEVFLFKSEKPIGFAVAEWDFQAGRFGFLLGISLTLDKILSKAPSFLSDLAALTGTLYVGNQPSTIALGQLNDPSTWLSFRFDASGFFDSSLVVAVCYQRVSVPGGPHAVGLLASLKGGKDFGFGRVQAYVEFSAIIGRWRNESDAAGFVAILKAGLRIKVFWVFSFGISIGIEFTYLRTTPAYRRLDAWLKIETPWYLPDVSFHVEKVWHNVQVETVPLLSTPIVSASAFQPHTRAETVAGVTPILGSGMAAREVYAIADLQAVGNPSLSDTQIRQLAPVGLDSVIGLDFKPSMADRLTIGENTPAGAGVEKPTAPAESDLEASYELVEIGIRRRPRFDASPAWSIVLDPASTRIGQTSTPPPPDAFRSFIRVAWDKDIVREGQWDARRLLLNSATPYTFADSSPETDEMLAHGELGWPCCTGGGKKEVWHELGFDETPFGRRAPLAQRFSDSQSTLHWMVHPTPIVMSGIAAPAGSHAARVRFDGRGDGLFAVISLDEPVQKLRMHIFWRQAHSNAAIRVEAYDGLERRIDKAFPLNVAQSSGALLLESADGFSSVELHFDPNVFSDEPDSGKGNATDVIEIVRLQYRTVREVLDDRVFDERCRTQDERAHAGGGTLAWLPNHEYEISAVTRMTVTHAESGTQQIDVRQRAYFRTKGLIGLNASPAMGDEVTPYVESRYPGGALLYRAEAVSLAFSEAFNILLPVDPRSTPGAPPEVTQVLEWVLAVEKVTGSLEAERITQTSPDWVLAHRQLPLPPRAGQPVVLDGTVFAARVRQAVTHDPLRQRFEAMLFGPFGCEPGGKLLHRSQVLTHAPINPRATGTEAARWEPGGVYRVNVRRKGSPNGPFVDRKGFDVNDYTAFAAAADPGVSVVPWRSPDGVMRLQPPPAGAGKRYALFGEAAWNHVQVHADVDPRGGAAGIAVAVGVTGPSSVTRALTVLVDERTRRLSIVERTGATEAERAGAPLAADAVAPYSVELFAFDDKLRARVNETILEVDRNSVRDGRLALVADGAGTVARLVVEPLDAYRFEFQASQFADFPAHISSGPSEPGELRLDASGLATETAASLLAATAADIDRLMAAGADPEERQRLFDRWTAGLALPLRTRTTRVELTRLVSADHTEALLLETPEPLPFGADVDVALRKRAFQLPLPGSGGPLPPRPHMLGVSIDIDESRASLGPLRPSNTTRELLDLRWLVHGVQQDEQLVYRVYAMEPTSPTPGTVLVTGPLTETLRSHGTGHESSPILLAVAGMAANEIALLDDQLELLFDRFVPLTPSTFEIVPTRVLTNATETVALLIPLTTTGSPTPLPLPGGHYRLDFHLDRVRFRAETPDNTSNYRSEATLPLQW